MSEKIPKYFISSVDAARDFKKTNDYIALLCRRGQVRGVLSDFQWYVDPASLVTYFAEQEEKKAQRRRELSQQLSTEYRQSVHAVPPVFRTAPSSVAMLAGAMLLVLAGSIAAKSQLVNNEARSNLAASVAEINSPFFGAQGAPTQKQSATQAPIMLPVPKLPLAVGFFPIAATSSPKTSLVVVAQSTPGASAPVVERVIERTVVSGVTEDELTLGLQNLYNRLAVQISNLQNPGHESPLQNFAVSQVINNLSNVRLNGDTVADNINGQYALVKRLDVTGDSNFAGNANISGNVHIDGQFTAATTTIASLNISGDTVLSNATSTNFFATTASSTNLFALNSLLANATSTNFFATTASSTNLFAQHANLGALSITGISNFFNGFVSQASTTIGNGTQTGGLTVSGGATTTGSAYVGGNLFVGGNSTTLGNSSSNTLVINSSIQSNIIPDQNIQYDLGSPSFFWRNGYIGTLTANNIVANNTQIGGTQSATFTINSDNVSADAEDADLIFFRGNVVPNALLSWKSALKRFEFNQPLFIQNASSNGQAVVTLDVKGLSGQTADLVRVASSTGANFFSVTSGGNVGIGTSTPSAKLQVTKVGSAFPVNSGSTQSAGQLARFDDFSGTALDVGGNGTSGYWLQVANTGNLAIVAPLLLNPNGGSVGIGTTNPGQRLEVNGNIYAHGSGGTIGYLYTSDGTNGMVQAATGNLYLRPVAGTSNVVMDVGNVGVGNTAPTYKFDVTGLGHFTGLVDAPNFVATSSTATSTFAGGLTVGGNNFNVTPNGNVGIGAATDGAFPFEISNSSGALAQFTRAGTGVMQFGYTGGLGANASGLSSDNGDFQFTAAGTVSKQGFIFQTRNSSNGLINALYVNNGGFVGIGTTTPLALLDVNGNVASYRPTIFNVGSTTAATGLTTSLFNVNANGNVGIGTASPASTLDVHGRLTFSGHNQPTVGNPSITSTVSSPNSILEFHSPTNGGSGGGWYGMEDFYTSFNGGADVLTMRLRNQNVGIGSSTPFARLSVKGGGTTTGVNFQTTNSSDAPLFSILDNGSVGIGTTTPNYLLTVGDLGKTGRVQIDGNMAASTLGFGNGQYAGTTPVYNSTVVTTAAGTAAGNSMVFNIASGVNSVQSNVLTLLGSGNVGIGTTSPSQLLSIGGSHPVINLQDTANGRGAYFGLSDGFNTTVNNTGGGLVALQNNGTNALTAYGGGVSVGTYAAATLPPTNGLIVSGNVGIGTSNPGWLLNVKATAANTFPFVIQKHDATATGFFVQETSGGDFQQYINDTNNATKIFLTSNGSSFLAGGNVGIGTSSPRFRLDVSNSCASLACIGANIESTNGNGYSGGLAFTLNPSGGGEYAGALITTENTNNGGANDGGKISFLTAAQDGSHTLTRRMVIDTAGNVGVGVTSPSAKLDVGGPTWIRGAAAAGALFAIIPDATSGANGVTFDTSFATGGYGPLIIKTGGSEALRIANGGNVGIGTTSPATNLSVSGNAYITNGLGVGLVDTNAGEIKAAGNIVAYQAIYAANLANSGDALFIGNDSKLRDIDIANTAGLWGISNGAEGGLQLGSGGPTLYGKSGNLGIGNTAPRAFLEVGALPSSGGTVPQAASFNASSDNFNVMQIERSGVANPQGLYFGVNQASLYSEIQSSHSNVATDALVLNRQGGNVGIGTIAPKLKLEVAGANAAESGTATPNGGFLVGNGTAANSQVLTMGVLDGAGNHAWIQSRNNSTTGVYTLALNPSGGSVGIGMTSPGAKLDVNGSVGFQSQFIGNNKAIFDTTDAYLRLNQTNAFTNGVWMGSSALRMGQGTFELGSQGGAGEVSISGTSADATNRITINGNSGANSWFNAGNVGIGTAAPGYKLDVNGIINAPLASGYYLGGNQVVLSGGNYMNFYSSAPGSGAALTLGNAADPSFYANGTNTYIRSQNGASTFATFNATGLNLGGSLSMNRNTIYLGGAGDLNHAIGNGLDTINGTSDGETFTGHQFINLKSNLYGASMMFLNGANGKVGIGSTAPGAKLSIANGADDPNNYGKALQITNANGNRQQIAFIRNGNNVVSAGYAGASSVWGFGMGNLTDASFVPNYVSMDAGTGYVGVGTASPHMTLDISTPSAPNGDGITMGQTNGDNTESIQAYIDGHYSDRTTYGSGCCNVLQLQPDVGTVQLGGFVTVDHVGNITANGSITSNQVGNPAFQINGAVNTRYTRVYTSGSARWDYGIDGGAESGGNAGSNFFINEFSDAGAYIATPLSITRSTAKVTLSNDLGVGGSITSAGNVNITGSGCFMVNGTCLSDTVVKLTAVRTGTATTNWSKPTGFSYAVIEMWGAGGGGGFGVNSNPAAGGGGGGGAGGYMEKEFTNTALSGTSTVRVLVGAGGGGSGSCGAGAAGGTSNFGGMASSTGGGGGGPSCSSGGAGGTAGSGSGGDTNLVGQGGGAGNFDGSNWFAGSAGGIAPRTNLSGGGAGAPPLLAGPAQVGSTPGGGGGGGSGSAGASGGAGMYVIYEYTTVASGSDLAENYPVADPTIGSGDIVGFASSTPTEVSRAVANADMPLAGIISTAPGQTFGDTGAQAAGQRPVALSGRVPVKVNYENGDIHTGDRIALSSVAGVGRKANMFEASVGIAIEDHIQAASSTADTVTVFMDLQQGLSLKDLGSALSNQFDIITATTTAAQLVADVSTSTVSTSSPQATTATSTPPSNPITSITSAFSSTLRASVGALGNMVVKVFNGAISASVGIFNKVFAKELHAGLLCLSDDTGETCVTKTQLDSFVAGVGASQNSGGTATSTPDGTGGDSSGSATSTDDGSGNATSTPDGSDTVAPAITLIGADPAQLNVGDSYIDPGATVADTGSPNIGYTVSLDGATSTPPDQLHVDTSTAGTHIVLFSATDGAGNTGTATRTVIVSDPNAGSEADSTSSPQATSTDDGAGN